VDARAEHLLCPVNGGTRAESRQMMGCTVTLCDRPKRLLLAKSLSKRSEMLLLL
jgi:hypothetical protein